LICRVQKDPAYNYHFRMKKLWTVAAAAVCLMTFLHAQPRAQKDDDETKRVSDATTIFDEIMAAEDKSIPHGDSQARRRGSRSSRARSRRVWSLAACAVAAS
jgi:uncharacterized membrane protein